MTDTKMVILIRKDLKMSPGKAAAQAGHASILWLLQAAIDGSTFLPSYWTKIKSHWAFDGYEGKGSAWGGMKKIILGVSNFEEMSYFADLAKKDQLDVNYVFDEGLNTTTCVAIGPDESAKIDLITQNLKLYNPSYNPKLKNVAAFIAQMMIIIFMIMTVNVMYYQFLKMIGVIN